MERIADSWPQRWLLVTLRGSARLIGVQAARTLVVAVTRLSSRTSRGYWKTVHRLSPRLAASHLRLTTMPESWSSSSPIVKARRLGLDLELDLRDNLQRTLYYAATYEPELVRFLQAEVRRSDVFVDVGAHIGVHVLGVARRLRRLGGGTAIAFEPAPDTAEKLRLAAARAGLDVCVVQQALGDQVGTLDLYGDPRYDAADAGVRSQFVTGRHVARVMATTLDAWAGEAGLDRLDVVKIDVEGAELRVLEGMRGCLGRFRPRAVVVEMKHTNLARAGVQEQAIHKLLDECGYKSTGQAFHRNEVFRPAPS